MWGGGTRPDILVSGAGVDGGGGQVEEGRPLWGRTLIRPPQRIIMGIWSITPTLVPQTFTPLPGLPPSLPVSLRMEPPVPGNA